MDGGNPARVASKITRATSLISMCQMPDLSEIQKHTYVAELISIALNGSPHERAVAADYLYRRYNAVVVEEPAGAVSAVLH